MASKTFSNLSCDEGVAAIKDVTDRLIALVRDNTDAPGHSDESRRRAAIAITNYEQAAMWAVRALLS